MLGMLQNIILLGLVSPYPNADTNEALPTEFRLLKYGANRAWKMDEGDKEIPFSKDDATRLMAGYLDAGKDIPIDWEHQSLNGEMGGYKPAAGWFKLGMKEDGIYATDVQWTPKAQEALKSREYRYFSPAMHYDDNGNMDLMLPCALTNLPALKDINALMNSIGVNNKKDKTMSDETKTEMLAATESLSAMKAEKDKAEKELQDFKIESMLEKAVLQGKLTPAKKDTLKAQAHVLGLSGLSIVLDNLDAKVSSTRHEEPTHKAEVKTDPNELTTIEKKLARSIGVSFEAFSAQKKITNERLMVSRGLTDVGYHKNELLSMTIDNTKSKEKAESMAVLSAGRGSMKLKANIINLGYAVSKIDEEK
jgi:phage I-like protein